MAHRVSVASSQNQFREGSVETTSHLSRLSLRVKVLPLIAALLLVNAAPVSAQTYPKRPVNLVVGYAAGGTGDVIARIIAQKLSDELGQSVVVENRPGASGGIAAHAVARAEPDGHTILVGQSAEIAINPHWMKGITYDPAKDLQPVALGVIVPLGLVVPAKAPYSSLRELINDAHNSKKGASYASAGTGTPSHFAAELLKLRTQSKISHVPYKGAGPALNDLVGGHVDLYFPGLPAVIGNVRSGQLKLLAVSSGVRSSIFPEIPTVAEVVDIPGYDITLWIGFFVPRGTPPEIVNRLNQEINKVLTQPDVKARFIGEGADVKPMSVDQFANFVKAESEKYAQIIKDTGFSPE